MAEKYEVTWLGPYGWDQTTFESWDDEGASAFFNEHRPASLRRGDKVLAVRH